MTELPREIKRQSCSNCGNKIPQSSPAELCPSCLMLQGLSDPVDDDVSDEGTETSDSPAELPKPKEAYDSPLLNMQSGEMIGHYRIAKRIGRGGMGVVYAARDTNENRNVALKVLARPLDNIEARKRFMREGRLAGAVCHRNSVAVYGTEEIENVPVISMELIRGGTLRRQVRENGPYDVADAVDIISQILLGLEAAHARGVLHRDIKPANCFIEPDGTVKLGDYGLSVSTGPRDEALTREGAMVGTPAFASPEQLRGEKLDERSDIYAVGVTLFFLLTGEMPFRGKNVVQLMINVLEQPAPRIDSLRHDLPAGIVNVVAKCLSKRRSRRYRDCGRLRRALAPFSSNPPARSSAWAKTFAVLSKKMTGR